MNKLILLGFVFTILSCSEIDCDGFAKTFQKREFSIIVDHLPSESRNFKIRGVDPITYQRFTYIDVDAWYLFFNHKIELGDTVVKKAGDTRMFIHKKDTILVFQYMCGGKTY